MTQHTSCLYFVMNIAAFIVRDVQRPKIECERVVFITHGIRCHVRLVGAVGHATLVHQFALELCFGDNSGNSSIHYVTKSVGFHLDVM